VFGEIPLFGMMVLMQSDNLSAIRHSLAHLLAAAVLEKYPEAKLAIGPVIENGFYYDIDFPKNTPLSAEDLPVLENRMRELARGDLPFEHQKVTADEARERFSGNPYKLELIDEIVERGEEITLYTVGGFTDLCRGGHVKTTEEIDPDAFSLTHLAGAYWRGDEKNAMLSRVYGLAFNTEAELKEYVTRMEEAKKRDHRKLGKELELYTIIDEVGPGLPLFYPKGTILRRIVENFITEEQEKRGYVPIWIPHITKGKLYEISGHLDKYDAMYAPMKVDEEDYYVKPMNCPHFMMLYASLPHSYRELPLRYTSTTTNYRYEKSGELNGLTRVRALTQDDCHVFCEPESIESEIEIMLSMIKDVYAPFGFDDFWVRVSLRDQNEKEKYIGGDEVWDTAENALRSVVAKTGWKSTEEKGEAAFYGPKLDFMFRDVLGREWQLSTIQLDFNLPERFELEYIASDGTKKRPVVIHRAILGSTERFLGILIEHFGGAFPLWLSPVQVKIVPVGEGQFEYARNILMALKNAGIRAELDDSNETLGKKVRAAKVEKIPYYLVVGTKEVEGNMVTVEHRDKGKVGEQTVSDFISLAQKEISQKTL